MSGHLRLSVTFFCVVFFCCSICYAQQNSIDSLRKSLPALNGFKKVDCLNALSEAYRNARQFNLSRASALQAVIQSRQLNYAMGSGDAYYNLASTGFEVRDFGEVESDCHISISFFKKVNAERKLAQSYVLLGRSVWAQSKFDTAKEAFDTANRLYLRLGDSTGLGITYSLMALEEEERGRYEESLRYGITALKFNNDEAFVALGQLYADVGDHETALEYYAKIKDRNIRIYSYLKIGESYYLQQKYDSAIHYYRLFIKDGGGISKKLLPKPYALLGSVYLKLKDYPKALFYLNSAIKDFRAEHNRNWIMRVLLELGRTYKEAGDKRSAIRYTRELLAAAEESGARQYIRDGHYLLFQLFDGLNQTDSAYVHLKRYTTLNNQINIDFSARKLAFYKTTHEREQAQLKIALLNKRRQLQQEELKQTAQQKRFLFIGLLALSLIGFVLVRNTLLKKRNEQQLRKLAESELHIQKLETKKQLGELEMQVLRTQMNPHFIFNSLNSINRFILLNNKSEASAYLTKFAKLVRMILQNSQSKMITLEQELESLALYLSLESLRFDHHFAYKITVHDDVDTARLLVPPLIIQPYTENAVWHGLMHKEEKGNIDIEVLLESGMLLLKITDDGVGRSRAGSLNAKSNLQHRSMGLGITSQRIQMAQELPSNESAVVINDLADTSGIPCGTEVIIKLPVIYD